MPAFLVTWAIGTALSYIANEGLKKKSQPVRPEVRVPGSSYDVTIPQFWGSGFVFPGNVIWTSGLTEIRTDQHHLEMVLFGETRTPYDHRVSLAV